MSESEETQRVTSDLKRLFVKIGTRKEDIKSLWFYLDSVKDHHPPTYEHSARMALLGYDVAKYIHIVDPKALVFPCALHDLGKTIIKKELLEKKINWTKEDEIEMEDHMKLGFAILKHTNEFSAWVMLYADRINNPLKEIPKIDIKFSEETKNLMKYCAGLVGLIDFYDAAKHRENDKFSPCLPRRLSSSGVKEVILKHHKDRKYLINELYGAGILN